MAGSRNGDRCALSRGSRRRSEAARLRRTARLPGGALDGSPLRAALAFDGATSDPPVKISPKSYASAEQALRAGLDDLNAGDAASCVDALTYAAEGGQPVARWKLGEMYADGVGVAARRRKGVPLLQPARSGLRRGRAGPAKPGRDRERLRRGRRLQPHRHSRQRRSSGPRAGAGAVPVRRLDLRRPGRAVQPRAYVHGRRAAAWRRTSWSRCDGFRSRPGRVTGLRRRCSGICCSPATACCRSGREASCG